MIDSDNDEVAEIIQHYIGRMPEEGGYVNRDLVFNCKDEELWLSGVAKGVESLVVPPSLHIDMSNVWAHPWGRIYTLLNKVKRNDPVGFLRTRMFAGWIVPLMDMANSSPDADVGTSDARGLIMRGSHLKYNYE